MVLVHGHVLRVTFCIDFQSCVALHKENERMIFWPKTIENTILKNVVLEFLFRLALKEKLCRSIRYRERAPSRIDKMRCLGNATAVMLF